MNSKPKINICLYPCNSLQEYLYFINPSNRFIDHSRCTVCNIETRLHRHLYYYPFYLSGFSQVLVVKSATCGHTKALIPTFAFGKGKRKISIAEKLELTRKYLTSPLSYAKIAKMYKLCKSYAFKVVNFFKNFDKFNNIIYLNL